jgi:hypothetical protein
MARFLDTVLSWSSSRLGLHRSTFLAVAFINVLFFTALAVWLGEKTVVYAQILMHWDAFIDPRVPASCSIEQILAGNADADFCNATIVKLLSFKEDIKSWLTWAGIFLTIVPYFTFKAAMKLSK